MKPVSVCSYFKKCGGCQLLDLTYEQQLASKQKQVERLLSPFGKVSPIIGMACPLHYRNKVHATFQKGPRGIISGIYEEKSHRVVPIKDCLIQDARANAIIATIERLVSSFKLSVYDDRRHEGFLRHVLIRTGHYSGEVLLVLVTGSPVFPARKAFIKALLEAHPEIRSIVQSINARHTSMVLGDREQVLYGEGFIEDKLCGLSFRISPKSFYQVNTVQTEQLYATAIAYAGLSGREMVLDAYCGIGTIGLIASAKAKHVIGVELSKSAVRDAIFNAKQNGVKNIRFYEGDAGAFLRVLAKERQHIDVVMMDPPRSGSDVAFMSSVVQLKPPTVVYVSCNPETLARDLKYFTSNGYRVMRIQPVDMFPGTGHVECVVLMSRVKK